MCVCVIVFCFSGIKQIELVHLPNAYTELHAEITSSNLTYAMTEGGRATHPAVCLVCGVVLDANGRGECTLHASSCGCGVGIFFLLQVGVNELFASEECLR